MRIATTVICCWLRPTLAYRATLHGALRMSHTLHVPRVLVAVADGSEDIETTVVIDVLRRAGVETTVASIEPGRLQVKLARGCKLEADNSLADVSSYTYDMLCIPGGMPGAQRISDSAEFVRMLAHHRHESKWIAAICAAPAVVLSVHGVLTADIAATCHASFADRLPNRTHAEERVVVDRAAKVVTSQGPGTAIEWALQCVACLKDVPAALSVAKPMHLPAGLVLV
jgi:protein deglycase